MTESQEKTKLVHESFGCLFKQLEPFDYHSKMVLEILFKVILEKKNGQRLHLPDKKE
jgi:hypothetical protein